MPCVSHLALCSQRHRKVLVHYFVPWAVVLNYSKVFLFVLNIHMVLNFREFIFSAGNEIFKSFNRNNLLFVEHNTVCNANIMLKTHSRNCWRKL